MLAGRWGGGVGAGARAGAGAGPGSDSEPEPESEFAGAAGDMTAQLAVLLHAAAAAASVAAQQPASLTLDVTVGAPLPLPPVATNFVGFSMEIYSVLHMIGPGDGQPRDSYAQLMRNLHGLSGAEGHPGPVLRIGGNSAEDSCFVAAGAPPPNLTHCVQNITMADLNAYRRFAEIAPNVTYVIDTNLMQGDPTVAAAHIRAIGEARLWPHVSAVEVGNECDHWPAAVQLSFADYEARFASFVAAMRAAGMPDRMVQGATFCCLNPTFILGLKSYARKFGSDLKTVSYHRYAASACASPDLAPGKLLSRQASAGQAAIMGGVAKEIAPVPLWGGEVNSASCGGVKNVSDTFASTLWVLDFLSELSKAKVMGVNFHGGPPDNNAYAPVVYDAAGTLTHVSPLYVGLVAWSELVANSSRWAAAEVKASVALKDSFAHAAISVQEAGGRTCSSLRVLVIAKDEGAPGDVAVTVQVPASVLAKPERTAKLLLLTAPSLASKSGVRWARQSFDGSTDGSPRGVRAAESVEGAGGRWAFALPQLSAAILVVKECNA